MFNFKTFIYFIFFFSPLADISGQCISVTKSPSTAVNSGLLGIIPWLNTSNVAVSNNNRSTALSISLGDISNYLVTNNYNFNIPASATICGITVDIEKKATPIIIIGNVKDNFVKLQKGLTMPGDNKKRRQTDPLVIVTLIMVDPMIFGGQPGLRLKSTQIHSVSPWLQNWVL